MHVRTFYYSHMSHVPNTMDQQDEVLGYIYNIYHNYVASWTDSGVSFLNNLMSCPATAAYAQY